MDKTKELAPFVPTPMEVVEQMLELAQVTSKDIVYDLGSGRRKNRYHRGKEI